jgi:hypothetical protein
MYVTSIQCCDAQGALVEVSRCNLALVSTQDHIMTGQSTFFVELAETAAMLHKATSRCVHGVV